MSDSREAEGNLVIDSTFMSRFFQPGNDLLGYILFLVSLVLWSEGRNLRSINIFLIIIAAFWLAVYLLTKTKIFTKNELDVKKPSKKRKFKLY